MRETLINGERFFVFQDVCRELGCRKSLRFVSKANRRGVGIKVPRMVLTPFNVVNAAGVEEMRKGLEIESSRAETRRRGEKNHET